MIKIPGEQVAAAYAKLSLDAAEFLSGLNSAESRFKSFASNVESTGSKLGAVLSTLGKGMVAGIAAAGTATLGSVKAFADFEKGLASVSKTTGMTGKDLEALGESLRDLARQGPVTVTELEKIAATAGSLGVGAQKMAAGDIAGARAEIMDFTKTISDMAVAFDMTADAVAPMVASIANVYKLPTNELALFGSQVNALENSMNATAPQILEFVNAFGGTAAMFGESAVKTAAFGAVLNSLGINGAEAATQIRSGLLQLLQSYEVSESAVKKYAKEHNVSMEQAAEALKINQKNVEKLAQVMGVSADEIRDRLNKDLYGTLVWIGSKLKDIQGDTEAAAIVSQIFGTYGYQAMMKIGEGAEQYDFALKQIQVDSKGLEREASVMANTISGQWARLKNNVRDVAIEIGKTASGPVRDFLALINDQAIPAVKDFFKALASGDWNKVFDMIKSTASTAFEEVKRIATTVIDTIKNTDWDAIWSGLKSTAATAWDGVKSLATDAINALRNVDWSAVWSSLKSTAQSAWDGVKSIAMTTIDTLSNVDWGKLWSTLKSSAVTAWEGVKSTAQTVIDTLSQTDWSKIFSTLKTAATTAFNEVVQIGSGIWSEISKTVNSVNWSDIGKKIGGLVKKGFEEVAKLNDSLQNDLNQAIQQGKFEDMGANLGKALRGGLEKILSLKGEGGGLFGMIKGVLGEAAQWFNLGYNAAVDFLRGFVSQIALPIYDSIVTPVINAIKSVLSYLGGLPVVGGYFEEAASRAEEYRDQGRENIKSWSEEVAKSGRYSGATPTLPTYTSSYVTPASSYVTPAGPTTVSATRNLNVITGTTYTGEKYEYKLTGDTFKDALNLIKTGLKPEQAWALAGGGSTKGKDWDKFIAMAIPVYRATEEERKKYEEEQAMKKAEEEKKAAEEAAKTTTDAAEDAAKTTTEAAEEEAKTEQTSAQNAAQVQQNAAQNFAQKAMAAAEEYRQKTLAAGNSVVGAAQYAETSLKLGAEVGGKFITNAGQAVVVSFDTATNKFQANVGSVGTSLKQSGDYNLIKAQEMGAVITNSGSDTGSKLSMGGSSAYSSLLSGGTTAMSYLSAGGASVYQKLASIPDIGVKIATAADYFASKVVSAAISAASAISHAVSGRSIGGALGTPIRYAEGGIVSSPIVGLIGEAGAEAIVPLKDRKAGWNVLRKILPLFGIRPFAEGGIIGAAEGSTGSETISASFQISYLDQAAAVFGSKLRYMLNYFRKTMDLIRLDSIKKWRDIIDSSTKVWNEFITSVSQKSIEFRMVVGKAFYDTATSLIATITAASIELSGRFDLMMTSFKESSQSTFNMLNSMFESFKNDILPAFINGWQSSLDTMKTSMSTTVTQITQMLNQIAQALTQLTGRQYTINVGATGGGYGGGGGGGTVNSYGGSQLYAENAFAEIGGICQVDISGMTPGLIQSLYSSGAWKPNEYPLSQQIYQSILGSLGQPSGGATGSAQNWSVSGNTVNYSNIASNVLSAATKGISKPASTSGAASSIWSAVTKTSSGMQIGSTSTKSVVKLGKYQHGGLALTPQIAMIAESGPEAIIPIEKLSKLSGEDNIIVNLYMDGHKISDAVMNRAARTLKSRGIKI